MIPVLIGLAIAAVIVVALLKWKTILDWFRGQSHLTQQDKDAVGFTLRETMANGKYSTIQGIFNQTNGEVAEAVKYESKDIADELKEREPLVVYS
jgi:hypothetical protein